jgi:cobalt/nickel transport protein
MVMNMKKAMIASFVLTLFVVCSVASAHFTMILPKLDAKAEDYLAELGETKTLYILWGHPFEHVLFDCPNVEVTLRDPEGVVTKLTPEEVTVEGVKAWKVSFKVEKMGDYIVAVKLYAKDHNLLDYTKAIIHCGEEAWEGWDAVVGQEVEVIPYTRPYGIEEGFVFSGKALFNGTPLANAVVEVEKYHTKDEAEPIVKLAEEKFKQDPPMMFTRVVKTNDKGEFAYTLDEPGIWFIGAYAEGEGGLEKRGVIIVPVLEKFPPEAEAKATVDLSELESKIDELSKKISTLESKISALEGASNQNISYGAIGLAIIAIIIAIVAIARR